MSSEAGSYTISTLLALPLAKFGSFLLWMFPSSLTSQNWKKIILAHISSSKLFLQIQTTPS
jgi:hypothetical protein